MQLEQTLQNYGVEDGLIGEIYTSGLEMYSPSGMGLPKFNAFKPIGIGGPKLSGFSFLESKKGTYGIGREEPIDVQGILERFRRPEVSKEHGLHINYEELVPGVKDPLSNVHIPLGKKKK